MNSKKVNNCNLLNPERWKLYFYPVIFFTVLCLNACKETTEAYIGFPLQPKIEENNYEAGLNIIGVIRPDFTDSINNSFIHVQEVAPAIKNYPEFTADSMLVKEAEVFIADTKGEIYNFSYTQYNNLFETDQYRPDSKFSPESGMLLSITCSYSNLPILTSKTIIPNKPEILDLSILNTSNKLYFEILADTTTFLYEIFVYNMNENTGYARVISNFNKNTAIEIELSSNEATHIEVYGYDYNLANYYLTSNTSLNFNKYRKTFGNVENGYGVFGSMNFLIFNLEIVLK